MSDFQVKIVNSPKTVNIVMLTGEMDEGGIEKLREIMNKLFDDSNIKIFIFDLAELEFINSKGIGYLVSVYTHLSKDKRQLILTSAREVVMDVISLIGLTSIIKYYETSEEALSNLKN